MKWRQMAGKLFRAVHLADGAAQFVLPIEISAKPALPSPLAADSSVVGSSRRFWRWEQLDNSAGISDAADL
jgi:hypothetical protein